MSSGEYKNNYSKKPLWQWILIYILVGGVVYALVYYFVLAQKGGYSSISPSSTPTGVYNTPSTNSLY